MRIKSELLYIEVQAVRGYSSSDLILILYEQITRFEFQIKLFIYYSIVDPRFEL